MSYSLFSSNSDAGGEGILATFISPVELITGLGGGALGAGIEGGGGVSLIVGATNKM